MHMTVTNNPIAKKAKINSKRNIRAKENSSDYIVKVLKKTELVRSYLRLKKNQMVIMIDIIANTTLKEYSAVFKIVRFISNFSLITTSLNNLNASHTLTKIEFCKSARWIKLLTRVPLHQQELAK